MSQKIQKSVFIGLGGTGQGALLNIKKKLMDVYGEIPKACSFVCLDTDAAESLPTRSGGSVTLSAGEIYHMELRNPRPLLQSTEITPWWSTNVRAKALGRGAGGVRQLGRLALFGNAVEAQDRISAGISQVTNFSVGTLGNRFELIDNSVRVHVIGSIAGGTGAGTFLDVGMIARNLVTDMDSVMAHLLLPDVFAELPGVFNAEQNAYAAAQEIELLCAMRTGANDDLSYQFGGRTVVVKNTPFNIIFLVNNRTLQGITYSDVKQLKEFIGLGSFLSMGAAGQAQASIWDNISTRPPSEWEGRGLNFASYGLAELFFDRERYADFYSKRIAKELVDAIFFTGERRDISSEVRNFLLSEALVEDDQDQVIDEILKPADFTKFVVPQDLTPEAMKGLTGRRDSYLTQVDRELDAKAAPAAAALRSAKIAALDTYVQARLGEAGGFSLARSFLETLSGTLEAFRDMMRDERDRYKDQMQVAGGQYPGLAKDADAATKVLFGGAERKRKAANNIAKAFMGEASCRLEIRRREEAMAFFAAMLEETRRLVTALTDVAGVAHVANTELSNSIERMRTTKGQLKPFELLLEPPGLYDVDIVVSVADFLGWLRDSASMGLSDLGGVRADDFIDIIERYARVQPLVQGMLKTTIGQAISGLSQEQQEGYCRELFDRSNPLWCYSDGEVNKGAHRADVIRSRVIGFPSEEDPAFSQRTREAAGGRGDDRLVSTGDDERLFAITTEALLPAFVIDNFARYREKYLSHEPKEREQFHFSRAWIKNLIDLVPNIRSGQSSVWTLALAMAKIKEGVQVPYGSIQKNGSVYYFVSKNAPATKDYKVKLGQGRLQAYEAFMDEPDYLAEAQEQLEEENSRRGKEAVLGALRAYKAEFEADPANKKIQNDDVRSLVEQELKDLDELMADFTTLK